MYACLANFYFIVESFLEVGPYLLKQPGVKFLYAERFNQDPLEAFFGQQRAKGGRNDNPTVMQFCDAAASLRIQSQLHLSLFKAVVRGKIIILWMIHHFQRGEDDII